MNTNDVENQNYFENKIEKLETKIYQMERKNTYIKNILRTFIDIAKYYKIIDNEQNRSHSKMTKSFNEIKEITLASLIAYKIVTFFVFIIFFLFEILQSKTTLYLYFFFENCFFIITCYEFSSLIKKNKLLFETEQSLLVKELRDHIDIMNRDQKFLNDLIETN